MITGFPRHEIYRLTSQMWRAAISVAAHIGEGFAKHGKADNARFLLLAPCFLLLIKQ
jgi:four helix bundle protein